MESHKVCGEIDEQFMENELLLPYTHLLQISGKQMRTKIMKAFNYWFNVPEEHLDKVFDIINMAHIANLIMDDIQDDAKVRRGLPSAHCMYGVPAASNTAYHTHLLVINKAYEMDPKISKIFAERFLGGIRGQGMDIYWRENFICPTEEQYMKMVSLKSGHIFTAAHDMMQHYSDNKTGYSELVTVMGVYFQIRDDYCNLSHREGLEEWPGEEDVQAIEDTDLYDDITEGKFSFPIIHAMKTPEHTQILNILKQRTHDIQMKKYCVSLLERIGSLQYTRDALAKFDRDARSEVAKHGGNPLMISVLDELLSWKID